MKLITPLENFFDRILNILMAIACIILSLVTLSVCLEVILRYFFNRPPVWVIELSEYALLYITFLGAAWVLKSNDHVSVDLFFAMMDGRKRTICTLIGFIICLLVSTVFIVYGARVTWDHFSKGIYNPTILEVPKAAIIMIIPLGGLTLFIESARGALHAIRKLKERQWNGG